MDLNTETRSIDFAIACPQAELSASVSMEAPWGFNLTTNKSKIMFCLKLLRNLCGLKDGGCDCIECFKSGLIARGFRKSQVDPCLLTRGSLLIAVCAHAMMIAVKSNEDIKFLLESLKNGVSMSTLKVDP